MYIADRTECFFIGLLLICLSIFIPSFAVAENTTYLFALERNGSVEGHLGVEMKFSGQSLITFESKCRFPDRAATTDVLETLSGEKHVSLNTGLQQQLTEMKYGLFSWEISLSEIGNEIRVVTNNHGESDELFIYPVLPTYDPISLLFSLGRHKNKSFEFYYIEEKHQKKMFAKCIDSGKWSIRFGGREIFAVQLDHYGMPEIIDFHRSAVPLLRPYKLRNICSRSGGLVVKKTISPQSALKDAVASLDKKVPWLSPLNSDGRRAEFRNIGHNAYGLHAEKVRMTGNVKNFVQENLLRKFGLKSEGQKNNLRVRKSGNQFILAGSFPLVYSRKYIEERFCPKLRGAEAGEIYRMDNCGRSLQFSFTVVEKKKGTCDIMVSNDLFRENYFKDLPEVVIFRFQPLNPEVKSNKMDYSGKTLLAQQEGEDFEFVIKAVKSRPDGMEEIVHHVRYNRLSFQDKIDAEEWTIQAKFPRIWLDENALKRRKLILIGEYEQPISSDWSCKVNSDRAFQNKYGINPGYFTPDYKLQAESVDKFVMVNYRPSDSISLGKEELKKKMADHFHQYTGISIDIGSLQVANDFSFVAKVVMDIDQQGFSKDFRFPAGSTIKKLRDGRLFLEYLNLQTCK